MVEWVCFADFQFSGHKSESDRTQVTTCLSRLSEWPFGREFWMANAVLKDTCYTFIMAPIDQGYL